MCDLHVMKKYLSSSGGAPAGQKILVFGCGKANCAQWWPSWRGGRVECCHAGCDTIDQDPERDPTFLMEFGPGVRIPVPEKYYDVVLMEGMHLWLPALRSRGRDMIREIYRVARDPKHVHINILKYGTYWTCSGSSFGDPRGTPYLTQQELQRIAAGDDTVSLCIDASDRIQDSLYHFRWLWYPLVPPTKAQWPR